MKPKLQPVPAWDKQPPGVSGVNSRVPNGSDQAESCPEFAQPGAGPLHSGIVGCVPVSHLSCVYQPIVDLKTGGTFAYESLARCRTPGLVNPEVLFKRAASEGFCGLLGRTLRAIASQGCRETPLFLNVQAARDCGCHYGQGFILGMPAPTPKDADWQL